VQKRTVTQHTKTLRHTRNAFNY